MANPHKGEVAFTAGDHSYVLHFSAEAICQLEDKLDLSINEIGKLMQDTAKFRMSVLRDVFWAGLLDKQSGIDIDATRAILSQLKPAQATALVAEAFTLAFAEDEPAAAVAGAVNGVRPPARPKRASEPMLLEEKEAGTG
jgi:hypothetical protein